MKTIIVHLSCLLALILIQSCLSPMLSSQEVTGNEMVMAEGITISATNHLGTIIIQAGPGFLRSYTWEGATRSVKMIPRKERWSGRFGIYFPGRGSHWKEHNNIQRGVLEEAQLHFVTVEDAMKFLRHSSRVESTVYTDMGLLLHGLNQLIHLAVLEVLYLLMSGKFTLMAKGQICTRKPK